MAIDSRAKRYIEDYEVALKKQLSYVKGNTWIKGFANRQQRIQEHDLQYALTSKNLDLLKNYYIFFYLFCLALVRTQLMLPQN